VLNYVDGSVPFTDDENNWDDNCILRNNFEAAACTMGFHVN